MPENRGDPPDRQAADETRSAETIRAKLARQLDERGARPTEAPPIPDHQVLHRIGSGAYGDVWLARNALGTLRAVKIVHRARFKEDRPYEREFGGILKYEPVSRTHEGLVQVLHVGRNDVVGCFYYVMELADAAKPQVQSSKFKVQSSHAPGDERPEETLNLELRTLNSYSPRTLRSELACRDRLPPAEAANLTLRLAKALEHLHLHGLVHRDIKPSNVIFVGEQPKLADIGLVTDVGSSHSFVGTEGFIPPEGPGTPQADLYGLGKLLYELATGRDRMDFPQLPPRVRQLPEGEGLLELNEVITRACAPEAKQRYATATELQADLNLFLAGRSLRLARNLERYLARLKKFAAAGCAFLVLLAVALWFSKREERHASEMASLAIDRAQAEAETRAKETILRQRAEAAEHETEQQLYTALLEQARTTVRSGELGQRVRALDAIRRAAAISNRVELRREAMAALALPDLRFEREMPVAASDFTLRWLDPAFERIALCRGRGPVEIRAVSDNRLLTTLPASTNRMAYAALWSRDGRFLAVKRDLVAGGFRADLEVWEVNDSRRVLLIHDVRSEARSFHPHKPQLLVGGADGSIAVWDVEKGKELARRTFDGTLRNLAYSPDGNLLAASHGLNESWGVSVHDAADGTLVASQMFTNFPASVEWHPDGRRIAVTDHGGLVQLMDSRTGVLQTLGRHKAEAATAVFSPSGDYLITGGWEREFICWDVRTMQRALTIGQEGWVAQFRADGRTCALVTEAGVQLHTFEVPTAHRELVPEMGRVWHARFSPDARWLAASADRQVGVWDLTGNAPGAFATEGSTAQLFWMPDGRELFGSGDDNCFRWRIQPATNPSAPPMLQPLELRRPAGFASLSLSSNSIVWTSSKGSRITSQEHVAADNEDWVETARGISRISPDARWLAIYAPYGTILHVYRLPGIEPVARLSNQVSIAGVSFSPLQDEVAIASRGQVKFWSTTSWTRTRTATNFMGIATIGMLFEPDGRSIWLAKDFRTAGLHESRTLEPLLFLPTGMFPLALDADARYLAVSVHAQRLQVWDLVAVREQLQELGLDWRNH